MNNDQKHTAIQAQDLSYNYPDGTPALKHISLTVAEGEKIAVIGPNGSGKSTLMTMFNGVRLGEGSLEIFGNPISKKNLSTIKRLVGLIFQNPDDQLFCPTIFEDVAFGPLNLGLSPKDVKYRVQQALANVGLSGYENRSSFHLSFGERKLASIATVLSMQPHLIAMDEPTANLDLAHRRKIIQWIQQNQKTTVLTTHDLDMVLETCQRVIILNQGQVVAEGETNNVLQDKHLLESNSLELPLRFQYELAGWK